MKKSEVQWLREVKNDVRVFYKIPKEEQTERIALAAITEFSGAITHVKEELRTAEFHLKAVKKNPYVLGDIDEQTEEMCLTALKKDGYCFNYFKIKTKSLLLKSVEVEPSILKLLEEQTEEFYLEAIKLNWKSVRYIKNPTHEMLMLAYVQNPQALNGLRF